MRRLLRTFRRFVSSSASPSEIIQQPLRSRLTPQFIRARLEQFNLTLPRTAYDYVQDHLGAFTSAFLVLVILYYYYEEKRSKEPVNQALVLAQKQIGAHEEGLQNLLHYYQSVMGFPGVQVTVMKDGIVLSNCGAGYQDVEQQVKCNSETKFRIASISKSMTVAALANLIEQGVLNWDTPIGTYDASLPDKVKNITLRQLASHTSGIRHYKSDNEFVMNEEFPTSQDALKIFINDALHEPAGKYVYSTFNYTLISHVMEKVTNTPFATLINEQVFKPYHLTDTRLDTAKPIIMNRARFYRRRDNSTLIHVPQVNSSYKYAGGGVLSNAHDLCVFGHAIMNDSKKQYLFQLDQVVSQTADGKSKANLTQYSNYALGFSVKEFPKTATESKLMCISHSGGAVGSSSYLLMIPERNMVVAVMCNMENVTLAPLAMELAEYYKNENPRRIMNKIKNMII